MVKEARLESLQFKTKAVFFPKLNAQNELQQLFLILLISTQGLFVVKKFVDIYVQLDILVYW